MQNQKLCGLFQQQHEPLTISFVAFVNRGHVPTESIVWVWGCLFESNKSFVVVLEFYAHFMRGDLLEQAQTWKWGGIIGHATRTFPMRDMIRLRYGPTHYPQLFGCGWVS